jgi:hypothetical protein
MQPRIAVLGFVAFILAVPACGSDEKGGGGSGGKSGVGGSQGTTCLDGYPTLGTACAIPFEECKSCGNNPPWPCCDVFECQNGTWAQTASHFTCPEDAGADASDADVELDAGILDAEAGD